ncbi:MAG: DUF86 domain-containing protein [Candidatus Moranbacteria bacterium]|nr:DUF86 domain-containing protein [Candidatus Moranbacteria bacterium]
MKGDKNTKVYLNDIYDCILKIEEYLEDFSEEHFYEDYEKQDSVLRRLEIIGEAVKQLSDEVKEKYPKIPWKDIAGTRDVLIHEYSGVNMIRIWKTVKKDIPELKKNIEEMLKKS